MCRSVRISEVARLALVNYDWPGNVRELERVIERVVALGMADSVRGSSSSMLKPGGASLTTGAAGSSARTVLRWALTFGCSLLFGCEPVEPVAVLVNHANVTKALVGRSSSDLPFRRFVPGSFDRIKRVDVVGDPTKDALVESDDRHGVDIKDGNGPFTLALTTPYFVTDFAPVRYPTSEDRAVVVATYPDERWGSSFTVFSLPEGKPLAEWQEYPPTKGFVDIGRWGRATAVFYIHEDFIVIRSPDGALHARLPLPGVRSLSFIHVVTLSDDRTVFLTSGNGATHYQKVAIYDRDGTLLFHEHGGDNAFRLVVAANETEFDVHTRSSVWRYHVGQSSLH